MESIVGKVLCDRYRVIKQLSKNNFSSIFLAEDIKHLSKQKCQIERLQPRYDGEVLGNRSWHNILQAFMAQGDMIKNISQHPQIPQLLAFFESDREFYLVREFIDGENLEQKVANALIDEAEAISWLREILEVLDFVHQVNIIHLNIQPSSLIQNRNGRRFLTNFSSVKDAVFFDKNLFTAIGNDDFCPAEQQENKSDFSTDIYALGKTIIYALTGKVTNYIKTESLPENSSLKIKDGVMANIKPELANILNKMAEEQPENRYQFATEVLEQLESNLEHLEQLKSEKSVVTLPPPIFTNPNLSPRRLESTQNSNKLQPKGKFKRFKQVIIGSLLALPFILAFILIYIGVNRNLYKDFETYNNDIYQFNIKYPEAWSQKNIDDPITGEVVVFSSGLETSSDPFLERVNIFVEYLSEPITLEEYTQSVFERIKQAKGSDIEVYQDSKAKISKYPARRVIYSRLENGLQLRQMEIFTIKDNRVYVAIYTAERAKFSKFLNQVNQIINSWEIE